jgi:hypothetical protein
MQSNEIAQVIRKNRESITMDQEYEQERIISEYQIKIENLNHFETKMKTKKD